MVKKIIEGHHEAKKKRRLTERIEPATKVQGKPFDPTTAPRETENRAIDASQDLQNKTTTAPRSGIKKKDRPSGTA
jgi:hypothetical protein